MNLELGMLLTAARGGIVTAAVFNQYLFDDGKDFHFLRLSDGAEVNTFADGTVDQTATLSCMPVHLKSRSKIAFARQNKIFTRLDDGTGVATEVFDAGQDAGDDLDINSMHYDVGTDVLYVAYGRQNNDSGSDNVYFDSTELDKADTWLETAQTFCCDLTLDFHGALGGATPPVSGFFWIEHQGAATTANDGRIRSLGGDGTDTTKEYGEIAWDDRDAVDGGKRMFATESADGDIWRYDAPLTVDITAGPDFQLFGGAGRQVEKTSSYDPTTDLLYFIHQSINGDRLYSFDASEAVTAFDNSTITEVSVDMVIAHSLNMGGGLLVTM